MKKNDSSIDFNWVSLEKKIQRSMQVSPEKKLEMLHQSLQFFNKIKFSQNNYNKSDSLR